MLVKDAHQPYKQSGNSNYSMEHAETISMTFPLAINDSQTKLIVLYLKLDRFLVFRNFP